MYKVLAVNPGSTSTKIALYDNLNCMFETALMHDADELEGFETAVSQLEYRYSKIIKVLEENSVNLSEIDAFAGRGGMLRPLRGGTYIVGKPMLEDLKSSKYGNHASNLGAIIAKRFAEKYGKEAYVVNPPVVDEMIDEARVTGLPAIRRKSIFHALNQKAAAYRAAEELGVDYEKCCFIAAHLGGGISVGAHCQGRVIDVNNAMEEGPFSPERAGSLPTGQLVDLCFSGKYTKAEIGRMLAGRGGLYAHTGTTDCRKLGIEAAGNENYRKILDAMAYNISKEICGCAAALFGKVDAVIITGSLAKSAYITENIKKRVSFLGRLFIYPGEDELSALAHSVTRVLQGREQALVYGEEAAGGKAT